MHHSNPGAEQEIVTDRALLWLQRDAMGPWNPALAAYPGSPVFFCMDDAWIREEDPSPLRIRFMTRCAAAMGATVVYGSARECLLQQARNSGATQIVTTATPCRHSHAACDALKQTIPLEILPVPRLVDHDGPFDLGSFSRFWKKAAAFAMPRRDPS